MSNSSQPILLAESQLKQACAVMGRAFFNDPFVKYLAPDDARRQRLAPEFLGIVVKYCFMHGEVWTFPSVDAVACWLTPGKTSPTLFGVFQSGMLTMPLKFGWSGFQRFNEAVSYLDNLHKQFANQPHWYLWGLGVEPSQQGKGLGRSVLQLVFSKADETGQFCYLETQNESNLSFYQKLGFEVATHGVVPKSSLQVWTMVRKPR